MVDDRNPYAAPAVANSPTTAAGTPNVSAARYRWAVGTAATCVLGSLAASGLAMWDIETIVGSGPVLCVAALILLVLARPKPLQYLWMPAASVLTSSLVIFLWIWLGELGPARAQIPVGRATIGAALVTQVGWVTLYQVISARHAEQRDTMDEHRTRPAVN